MVVESGIITLGYILEKYSSRISVGVLKKIWLSRDESRIGKKNWIMKLTKD